jgi:hypothetical protein
VSISDAEYHQHRLGGLLAKFNRAKQQFDELRFEMDEFFNQDPKPHFFRGYFDTDTWEWIERFQIREKPPLRFGVMLGDCVHNLRSALDHLICQLTMLNGGTMDDCARTQFTIASKSEAQFEGMAKTQLAGLSPMHRAVVKSLQPYHAGDQAWRHPLALLAELSNADKHRLVNPTYSVLKTDSNAALKRLAEGTYEGDGPNPVVAWFMAKEGQRLEHDAVWFRIVFDRSILTERPKEVKVSGHLTLGIAFGEIGLDADSYRHIGGAVLSIIEWFMRRFPETKYIDTPRPEAPRGL